MGISQSYPDGGYKRINKAYAEMYGYPDTSTMMKEVSSSAKLFSNPDDRKRVIEILDKSGYMPPTEFELNRRNGEKFWALVVRKTCMTTQVNCSIYRQSTLILQIKRNWRKKGIQPHFMPATLLKQVSILL